MTPFTAETLPELDNWDTVADLGSEILAGE